MSDRRSRRAAGRPTFKFLLGAALLATTSGCGGGDTASVAVVPGPAASSAATVFSQQLAPSLAVTPNVGKSASVIAGTYNGADSVNGQWLVDGVPISGATSTSYRITAADDTKTLSYRETAIRAGAAPIITTIVAPVPVMPALGGTLLAEGDSVLAGVGSSTPAKNWISQFASVFGLSLINRAVPGYGLEDEYSGGNVSNDRLTGDAVLVKYNHVIIAVGGNDTLRSTGSTALNPANFATQLRDRINLLRLAGYVPTDIILTSLYPIGNAALTSAGVSRATYEAFNATIQPIAQEYGLRFVDFYSINGGAGDPTLIGADGLHPSDGGYEKLYEFARYRATIPNRRGMPTGLTGYSSVRNQLNVSWNAVSDAPAGYVIEIEAGKSLRFSGNYAAADTSLVLMQIPSGTYRLRVRARYPDGQYGPWQFASQQIAVN